MLNSMIYSKGYISPQTQFNIIYIMRTNAHVDGMCRDSLTLVVNWLLSMMILRYPFLQTNQNQVSIRSK